MLAVVALVGFVADLVTKTVAASTLHVAEPVEVLDGFVYFQLVRNPAAAFGLGTGMTPLLTVFAMAVVAGILYFARKIRQVGWAIGFGLVLAGALGNLADRIFRAPGPFHGYVVDFISILAPNGAVWPVFNIADSCICVGAVLVVLLSLLGKEYDGHSVWRSGKRPGKSSGGSHEEAPGA